MYRRPKRHRSEPLGRNRGRETDAELGEIVLHFFGTVLATLKSDTSAEAVGAAAEAKKAPLWLSIGPSGTFSLDLGDGNGDRRSQHLWGSGMTIIALLSTIVVGVGGLAEPRFAGSFTEKRGRRRARFGCLHTSAGSSDSVDTPERLQRVILDRSCRLYLPAHFGFAPKATELRAASKMTRCAMCGRIWTPPDCNSSAGSGSSVTTADVYPASLRGLNLSCREPRWVFARFHLNAPKTSAKAVPVHTPGSGSDGVTVSPSLAILLQLSGETSLSSSTATRPCQAAFTDSVGS